MIVNPQYVIIGVEILETLFQLILKGIHPNISHEAINAHIDQVKNGLTPYQFPEKTEEMK